LVLNSTTHEMKSTKQSSGVLATATPQPQHRNSMQLKADVSGASQQLSMKNPEAVMLGASQ
jgi:hypothetical protein